MELKVYSWANSLHNVCLQKTSFTHAKMTLIPFSGFNVLYKHFECNLFESTLLQGLLCKWLNFHHLPILGHSIPFPFLAVFEIVTDRISTKLSSGG